MSRDHIDKINVTIVKATSALNSAKKAHKDALAAYNALVRETGTALRKQFISPNEFLTTQRMALASSPSGLCMFVRYKSDAVTSDRIIEQLAADGWIIQYIVPQGQGVMQAWVY